MDHFDSRFNPNFQISAGSLVWKAIQSLLGMLPCFRSGHRSWIRQIDEAKALFDTRIVTGGRFCVYRTALSSQSQGQEVDACTRYACLRAPPQ